MLRRRDPDGRRVSEAGGGPDSYDDPVRFEVLGPLRVVAPVGAGGGTQPGPDRPLGGPKQRLVLALLLAEPNTTVSVERLIDGLWGESPPGERPPHAPVVRVRAAQGARRRHRARRSRATRSGSTATRSTRWSFEDRVSEARAAARSRPGGGRRRARGGARPVAGPAVRGPSGPAVAPGRGAAARGAAARGDRGAVQGPARPRRAPRVVARPRAADREHPYREELRALQMLALYRSGPAGRRAPRVPGHPRDRWPRSSASTRRLGSGGSRSRSCSRTRTSTRPSRRPRRRRPPARDREPLHGPARLPRGGRAPVLRPGPTRRTALARRVVDGAVFTAVVGPSGSGKSSAVQAGLIPQAATRGARTCSSRRCSRARSPSRSSRRPSARCPATGPARPSPSCAASERGSPRRGARAAPRRRAAAAARRRSVRGAVHARGARRGDDVPRRPRAGADDPERACTCSSRCAPTSTTGRSPILASGRCSPTNVVNVIPLGPEELEAAATMPARQLDVIVEPRLVGRLIADVAGQPNALPLFQYALTELFDERAGPVLDLATYERIGGVRKAVARRAESIYSQLDGPEQEAVRQLFLRIATVSGEAVGRRRVPASELAALDVDIVALQGAIDAFARYRLLALDRDPTTGAPTVEVAHEALLARVASAARLDRREPRTTSPRTRASWSRCNEWETAGREPGYLLSGRAARRLRAWASTTAHASSPTSERRSSSESIDAREAEGEEKREREAPTPTAAPPDPLAARRPVRGRRGARRHHRLSAPHGRRTAPRRSRSRSSTPRTRAGSTSSWLAASSTPPRSTASRPWSSNRPTRRRRDLGRLPRTTPISCSAPSLMWDSMVASPPSTIRTRRWCSWTTSTRPQIPNGVGVSFANEEGSFLVGAAAALESKTGTDRLHRRQRQPAHRGVPRRASSRAPRPSDPTSRSSPRSSIRTTWAAAGTSTPSGRADDRRVAVHGGGCRRHLHRGGRLRARGDRGGDGLSDELGRHLWAIGVDTDFRLRAPRVEQRSHVLTSMVKRLDVGVERVVAAYEDGQARGPSTVRLESPTMRSATPRRVTACRPRPWRRFASCRSASPPARSSSTGYRAALRANPRRPRPSPA